MWEKAGDTWVTGGVAKGRLECGRELQVLWLGIGCGGRTEYIAKWREVCRQHWSKTGLLQWWRSRWCGIQICRKQISTGHRNILVLPALLIWGREESWWMEEGLKNSFPLTNTPPSMWRFNWNFFLFSSCFIIIFPVILIWKS